MIYVVVKFPVMLRQMGLDCGPSLIGFVQEPVAGFCEHENESPDSTRGGGFGQLSEYK